jgi:hypothetical protein
MYISKVNLLMRAKQFVPIVEAQSELFEVKMSPGSLKKLAGGVDALVGIEFEMIVPDIGSIDSDDMEAEEDMDYDEEAYDIDDIVNFFNDGDYNDRNTVRDLERELREKFNEWLSEKIDEEWNSDGKEYFIKWVKDNVDPDDVADHVDKEEDLFGNRDPDGSDWMQFIEDEWEERFNSDSYSSAYDEFREEKQDEGDFDEREFLRDIGIRYMSDATNVGDVFVSWPHWNYPDSDDSEMNLENLADAFSDAIGRKVHYSTGYHSGPRTSDAYTIEPDSSLSGSGGDAGLEFISPPLPIDEALEDVKKIKEWADDKGAYTNRTTGLHMNVSVPGFDQEKLDFVKLTLLLGDKYLLDRFGRSANTYCKSAMDIIEEAPSAQDKELLFKKLKDNLETMASKVIHSGRVGKFTSINPKDNRVEFRGPGGDWLGQNFDKIEETLYRCVVALDAAVDPEKYRKEYLKKLTKMFAPTKGSLEDAFVQYTAGTITREELKNKLKATQSQRKQEKLSKEGIVELGFYDARDGDYIIEYDNPTGDTRRMFLKRTEQVDTPDKAMNAAMKLEPSWFKPDDIENIFVTEYSGRHEYNVFDKNGGLVGNYLALTPLHAIEITLIYNIYNLPKQELTAKLASVYQQPETTTSEPEQEYKLYRVRGNDDSQYIAARSLGEAGRIALTAYPELGDRVSDLDIVLQDADPNVVNTYLRAQQSAIDNRNQSGRNGTTSGQPGEGERYQVSDVGDNGAGGVVVRATSPEQAIERARAAFNIPADRELQARLENG